MGFIRRALGWWTALLVFYLLLAAKWSWQEASAGAVAAGIATTAAVATYRAGGLAFRPRLRWLRLLARIPWSIFVDCGVVAAALWRRLVHGEMVTGSFRTVPFDPGGEGSVSAARRALVTAGVSLAPNTYVVAIDRDRGLLFVHQLVPSPQPPGNGDREWPL